MTSPHRTKIRKADKTGRTAGAEPRHVRLYDWTMDSEAWVYLSPAERCVYIEVERRYIPGNNGKIGLGVRAAAIACNISKDTAAKALTRLVDRGFLECTTPGGFATNACRAAEWRLTRAPSDVTQERATKAYMQWRPTPEMAAKKATKEKKRSPKIGTVQSENKDSRGAKWA